MTFTAGDPGHVAEHNRLAALGGSYGLWEGSGTADITTTSTSSTLVDITGATASVSAQAGDMLEVTFCFCAYHSSSTGDLFVGFAYNATAVDKTSQVRAPNSVAKPGAYIARQFRTVISGDISGGVVPVNAQWRTSTGTATIINSKFTTDPTVVPTLLVRNLSR